MNKERHVVVIGAGIGGLTAGSLLLKAGYKVTVLEAHVYPGGCAGTFEHKKYRFDAGATLAGGFTPGGPHYQLAQMLELEWPIRPVDPAWVVHLPDGRSVAQWASQSDWEAERIKAFPDAERFWKKQEMLADISWDVSTRPFPWPPESIEDLWTLTTSMRPKTFRSLPYLLRTIGSLAPKNDPMFKTFLDAQLLISAQATGDEANALYGSAAFDLPRRGVNHVHGGIGSLADTLVDWIRENGGEVLFGQEATGIEVKDGRVVAVTTKRKLHIPCDFVCANLTPWSLRNLLGDDAPAKLARDVDERLAPTWGAFMIYLGIDKETFLKKYPGAATHHQIVLDHTKPLGETNSIFFSMSELDDETRAPKGKVPVTMSTHTDISQWWRLREASREAYKERKARYLEAMLDGIENVFPGLRDAISYQIAGTPVSFQRFTRRPLGMVGGFPQKSILAARGPKTGIENLLFVGDSIFPGQSTAGVTLGGMRVAAQVQKYLRRNKSIIPVPQAEMA
ncbi:MAG: NAD(P)/FAD-dependent oxidoreductase [Chloroflexota bacterium]